MYVQGTTKASSLSHCCRGKAISIKYSECVSVTLVIQHAKRIYLIILSYYLINETIFEKKEILNTKCVFSFLYSFCLKHFSVQAEFNEILS